MNGPSIIRALIVANAGVIAIAPAEWIMCGTLPVGTLVPEDAGAIEITQISGDDPRNLAGTGQLAYSRVQVTVNTKDYDLTKLLVRKAKLACPNQRGSMSGVLSNGTPWTVGIDSVLPAGDGPDMENPDLELQIQSFDLMVKFYP